MRFIISITLFFFCIILNAQNTDSTYNLQIDIKAKLVEDSGYILQNTILRKEFTIKDITTDKYTIEIVNKGITTLSKYENNKWEVIDTFNTECYIVDTNKLFLPLFEITDFNKDGYQDLTCWVNTNINGNEWKYIFLFNPKLNRLEKLQNTAEIHWKTDSFIWDNPVFNYKNSTINCELYSSAYGVNFESKYKLLNYKAIPIKKKKVDMTKEKIVTNYYIGVNGEWRLKKHKK